MFEVRVLKESAVAKKFPPLITAMSRRGFYPHRPSEVELRQTHISYVFLAGPYVYKVKKSLRLPFLDYSTLDKRRYYCHEEIRLNRRLAPTAYLGVVPILKEQESFFLAENSAAKGEIAEYAVKMKRLPEDQTLSFRIGAHSVQPDHIRAIAHKLASFHKSASVEKAEEFGSSEAVGARVLANFRETERFVGRTISANLFEKIKAYSEVFLRENSDLFRSRIANGRVREGHGDLRAEHVCLLDDIVIFDCIEFDEALRYNDSASEIGFLSMDLDFLAASEFSKQLEEDYAAQVNDPEFASLLPFYKCYRAYVRGKVESLKSDEQEVPDEERWRATIEAQRYFCLSSRYGRGKSRQLLLVVCGLAGTGKSTVARMLSDLTGFPVFNSDEIRKKLAGVTPTAVSHTDYGRGIYTEEINELTYHTLWHEAEKHLARGEGVIVDATFRDSKHRAVFIEGAAKAGVPAYFVECRLDEETAKRRLIERAKRADNVSDATWETYQHMRGEFHPLLEIPEEWHFQIETEHTLLADLDRLEAVF
jgi:uncharacterized protein